MTLAEALLHELVEWRPRGKNNTLEVAHESGWQVQLTAKEVEKLSCQLSEFTLKGPAFPGETLGQRAEDVASRVPGLLEPLSVLEIDGGRGQALLRSNQPTQGATERAYYEALLGTDGTLTLRRFRVSLNESARRQQVPFILTHEALGKLIGELTR
jgi:hypothetical protein